MSVFCIVLLGIDAIDGWTRLLGPILGMPGFNIARAKWYVFGSCGIVLLVGAIYAPPQLYGEHGSLPPQAPRPSIWRNPTLANPSDFPGDRLLPQRPLLQVSILEMLFLTAGTLAILVSHSHKTVTALCFTASFLTGMLGAKFGLAMSARRLAFGLIFGFAAGGAIGFVLAYVYAVVLNIWPIQVPIRHFDPTPLPERLLQLEHHILPRTFAAATLASALYLLLQALNARLAVAPSSTPAEIDEAQ